MRSWCTKKTLLKTKQEIYNNDYYLEIILSTYEDESIAEEKQDDTWKWYKNREEISFQEQKLIKDII